MAYTTIDNPELYFQNKLYTGDASATAHTLDGSENMQPDLAWFKSRSRADNSRIVDALRTTYSIKSNTNGAEVDSASDGFTSLDADGFTLNGSGGGGEFNAASGTYVTWCWKANGSGSSNEDGTINTTATSANTTAGFSISTYTGSGSGATIGHGLGVAPPFYIVKNRGRAANWAVYHNDITASDGGVNNTTWLVLNQDVASQSNDSGRWNATSPTSTTVSVGVSYDQNNRSSDTYVAYCWVPIQGYSKFGSYIGNGNADGTFVYTGFRPAFVMTKSVVSTSSWEIFDNKREGYNVDNDALVANATTVEATADQIDILSNGFKCRIATDPNVAETYVYMAFAEAPFVNSNGVPCNAR